MIRKILKNFEDPSRPLLGPYVKALKFWGLLLPDNLNMKRIYIFLHSVVAVFILCQFIDIWFSRSDIMLLAKNIKVTLLTAISFVKLCTFIFWRKEWESIIEYVTAADIEQRKTTNEKNMTIICNFTRYCRKITVLHCSLGYTIMCVVIFQPIIIYLSSPIYRANIKNGTESYFQVVSAWVPFDKNTPIGYIVASAFQYHMAIFSTHWIHCFDTNAVAIMIFFKGELELLRIDSSEIFGTIKDSISDAEAFNRIKSCHRRHTLLIHNSRLFNKCLSPIMFFYMLVCSVMLCVTAFQIIEYPGIFERVTNIGYLVFSVAQLFFFCWHANEVFNASTYLIHGPYESLWWTRNTKIRKDIYILTAQFTTLIVFSAGPFIDLNVATFIGILKGAYSYFTLLSQSQM